MAAASSTGGVVLLTAWSVRRTRRAPYGSAVAAGERFGSDDAARGYASARPPVHPEVVHLAAELTGLPAQVDVALDIGCGAGLSTRPLVHRARRCLAVDPAPAMVRFVADVAPGAVGVVARAEALPVPDRSVDLATAAGSLDFVGDLGAAARELRRVLAPGGVALVYDFTTGRRLRAGPDLDPWFAEVLRRWPRPPRVRPPLGAQALADAGFAVDRQTFEVDVVMTRAAYVDYLLTESFLSAALARGDDRDDIARSLTSTVPWPVVDGTAVDVVFDGYLLVGRRP
jgi:SAM-dependent methyltransferase